MDLRLKSFINVSVLIVLTLCRLQKAESCRFGVGCPLLCHCKDDAPCDPWTGECPDGCADDGGVQWSGQACQIGNLALGKATIQSRTALLVQDPVDDPSTDVPLVGKLAVDGDLNTDVNRPPHCARAYATGINLAQETSWTVNLGQKSTVYSVTIYTGDDCCGGAKGSFAVRVGSSTTNFPNYCGSSNDGVTNADGSITVSCESNGLQGSFVKVYRPSDQSNLTLCEVIVLGSTYIDCSQCPQDKTCDSIVGCEECIGKKLPDCKTDCDFGKYGVNCQSTCGQCADGTDCNKITGRCDNCDPWTTGDACEKSIDAVDMGSISLVADDVKSDYIQVTWPQVQVTEDIRPFYTYRFHYKPHESTAWIEREHLKLGSEPHVQHLVGGLQHNTEYDFKLWVTRELDGKQDNGQPTNVLTEKTRCIAPAKPAKPEVEASITEDGMMTLNVSWQDVRELDSGCDSLDKVELKYRRGDAVQVIDVLLDEISTTIKHQSNLIYDIRVQVTNNEGLTSQSDSAIYQGSDGSNQSAASGDDDNEIDLRVVGIFVGAVGLLVLVIAGVMIYWSARNWSAAKKPRPRKQKKDIEETPRPFVVTGPLPEYPSEPETQDTTLDTEVPAKIEDTFIPVPEFEAYVQENIVDGNGVRVQFMALPSGLEHEVTVANRQESLPKNRFRNILPYDKNRVVLDSDDNPDSDYINASYMSGYKDKPKYYVAMQGPLPNTVDDTWRAIWQLCANTIVMVTSLTEGDTIKCEQYWPNRGVQQTYGEIQVRTLEEDVYAHHTLRTFIVIKEGFKRTVKHFHFTDWPDLGEIDQAFPLLRFREVVRSIDHLATGPMLVHCSAGAGRSGVFIALDYLLEQAKQEGGVDVFECLKAMRANRPHMGGNVRQYVFLHTVLNEAFLYGRTAIPCSRFAPAFAELKHGDEEDGNTSKLADQFATVEKLTSVNTETEESAGLTDENMNKNRHNALIPNDANRPLLKTRPGVDSDYINAVFVTSYYSKRGFIVTQTPLQNTVNDFWRLVSDYNVCSIVMMHENLDNDAAPTYWPQSPGKPTEYGGLEVTLHGETQAPKQGYIEREFNLSQDENLEGSNQLVKQWELLGWYKDHEIPDYLSTTLLSLLKDVNRWQKQRMSSSPILIHCMDGATRCGLVCAVNYLIDMAKTESKVDIFNAVRDIRMSRSQLVSNLDQYQFLHEAVLEYLAVDELEAAAN